MTSLEQRLLKLQRNAEIARARNPLPIADPLPTSHENTHTPYRETILDREKRGLLQSHVIKPGHEFPTLMTRLPIFPPINRARQSKFLDKDNAYPFTTPFGSGRRVGPPLTVEDEDTLIVLLMLRGQRLKGQGRILPIPITQTYKPDRDGNLMVDTVICSISDILDIKGLKNGGATREWTIDSIKRIAATSLEIETKKHDRYFGNVRKGASIKLLDVAWTVYENEGYLIVQFYPIIVDWLMNEYTYISWKVRRELCDLGKSLHRFLSSQPKFYSNELIPVAKTIGFNGPNKNMKPRFSAALQKLKDLGWLMDFKIVGTGRRQPLWLETTR